MDAAAGRALTAAIRRFARLSRAAFEADEKAWIAAAWTEGCLVIVADARSVKAKRLAELLEAEGLAHPQRDRKRL